MTTRVCVFLLFASVGWAQRCDPPAEIHELLRTLPEDNGARHKALGEAVQSKPENFWLNRLFLDGSVYEPSAIRERYRARFEANPSAENQYLYGRSLVGSDTKQALRIYGQILEEDPDNPWVHFSQLEIYRSEAFRDRAKLRASFEAVARACPSWSEPYRYLSAVDDEALAPAADRLRKLLEASKDAQDLRQYTALWAAEFRSKREDEKARVAADLKRLGEIEGMQATIAAGAKLIGDDALAKKMTPPRPFDIFEARGTWEQAHPYPKADDPPEKKRAYAEARLAVSAEWIAKAPQRVGGYASRLSALELMEAPAEEIAKAAEDVVRIARADDRAEAFSYIANIAHMYVSRGIQLDRVSALVEEALKLADNLEAVIEIDLSPHPEIPLENRMTRASWHVGALATLSEYYEKVGQREKARAVMAPVPAYLARFPVPEGTRNVNVGHNIVVMHGLAEHAYWTLMAELDEHENKKDEALGEYRKALIAWDGAKDRELAHQRQLWKDLGRTDEAWQQWVDAIPPSAWREPAPAPAGFAAVHRPLPKVVLRDLDGNEWQGDRLTKTTIATVWATWCEPCRKELPYFAKLAERLKDRADVQVISFNTDDNPETARQFVEQHGYRFPVLSAKNFAEDLMPYFAVPRTWIIREGAIVEEALGFGGDGEQWVERVAARFR